MIMEFGTRGIARICESADVDFIVFDMEHSGFDVERLFDLIAWSRSCSFAPMVRVPQPHYHFLARIMDAGALGVMIGNVETPEAARDIVAAVKYAPFGRRGVALGVAHNDYVMPSPTQYMSDINQSAVVICQIESPLGVSNAEWIAATPGVDCLWVGHYDLSTSMGIPGDFASDQFQEALRTVVAAGRRHGKLLGIQPGNTEQAANWLKAGFNVISWSSDVGVYRSALQSEVRALRELGRSLG